MITDVKKYQEIRPFFVDFNLNYIILKDGLKIESVLSDKIARPSFEKTADVSLVVHTTGTTGKKKGVVLTNNSLLEATKAINSIMRIPQRPIEIIAMPLSRSFGLARMRCVLMKNGTIIISRGLLNPALFIKNILDNKVSGFGLVPFGIRLLLPRFSKYLQDLSAQIDYIEMGSSPFSLTEKQNLQKLMPHTNIFMHYGLTEASRSTFINFKDKDNLASVGQPSPGVEIKIFGEDMQELGINQIGRIMIKSNWIFEGYIGEKTADSFYEGWFQTDDMGKIDEKGYLYFESRNSDLLNYRGYKFSPLEIEEVINKNPDVKCSCVAMTSSPGSKILAFVETKTRNNSTLKNLKNSCRKNLETYKVPSEIVAVKKIEKSDTGKIKRRYMVDKHAR